MNRIIGFICATLFLIGCASVDELIESGQYDQAIKKGIQKLEKTPNDVVVKKSVINAYVLAQERDQRSLNTLREMEESTSTWEMIYKTYTKMNLRDQTLQSANITPPIGSMVIKEEMYYAHDKLCNGYTGIAEDKMRENLRHSYQEAYANWSKVAQYNCGNSELDSLMNVCLNLGKAVVALQLDVQSGVAFPEKTKKELSSLSYSKNQKLGKWVKFVNDYDLNQKIDYTIICRFNQITVSQNQESVKKTEVKKQVIDRYESRKNAEGKLQEYPVYVTATAVLKKVTHKKQSTQGVYFEIMDNSKSTTLYQKQLVGKYDYLYTYTEASGDLRALSKDQKKLLKKKKRAFPSNSYMVEKSGKQLKSVVENEIYKQRNFLN